MNSNAQSYAQFTGEKKLEAIQELEIKLLLQVGMLIVRWPPLGIPSASDASDSLRKRASDKFTRTDRQPIREFLILIC